MLANRYIHITLHDISGNYIKELKPWEEIAEGEVKVKFNVSDITAGVYMLSIITDKGERVIKRIIKQ